MNKLTSANRVAQSYLARKPVNEKLHLVQRGDHLAGGWVINKPGYAITGELGAASVQIFSNPDRVIQDFANTEGRPEDILRFTKRYGVLHRSDKTWTEISPDEEQEDDLFCVHCSNWLQSQERFREEWARKKKSNDETATAFEEQINPTHRAGRAVKAFVRPGKGGGLQLELQPDDLLGALWLALLGASDKARKCQNPTCLAPYFLASRRDQKFCNEKCSRLVANRKWWTEKGAEWRKENLKDKRGTAK
jgi:hypothetical protein